MPSTLVYLDDRPSRIALMAASLMFSGVSKSGSPAPRPMTSRPASLPTRRRAPDALATGRIEVAFKNLCRGGLVGRCAWGGSETKKPEQEPNPAQGNVHPLPYPPLRQLLQSSLTTKHLISSPLG